MEFLFCSAGELNLSFGLKLCKLLGISFLKNALSHFEGSMSRKSGSKFHLFTLLGPLVFRGRYPAQFSMKQNSRLIPTIVIGCVMHAGLSLICVGLASLVTNGQLNELFAMLAYSYLPAILMGVALGFTPGLGWRSLSAFICSLLFLYESFPTLEWFYAAPASLLAAGAAYIVQYRMRTAS